jgi:hypothetical protein
MTLTLPCRVRLILALLLIALLSVTLSSGTVHWLAAPAPAASRGATEGLQENDQRPHVPDE